MFKILKIIRKIIIYIFFIELFLGGGGRIFAVGQISLRKILFCVILLLYLIKLLQCKKFAFNITTLCSLVLFGFCILSCFIGIFSSNSFAAIKGDIQPVLYLLMFLPVIRFSNCNINSDTIINLLFFSAFLTAITSIVLYFFGRYSNFSPYDLRVLLKDYLPENEYGIRKNGSVFLVGQFYIIIASIILFSKMLFDKGKKYYILLFITYIVAILQSTTRSSILTLLMSLCLLIFIKLLYSKRQCPKLILYILLSCAFMLIIILNIVDMERLFSFSDKGTLVRLSFLKEVFQCIEYDFLLGKGYGYYLLSKGTSHLECSYLEIFLEQGLIGLILWIILIASIVVNWILFCPSSKKTLSLKNGAIVSIFALILISFFNPYINNPVGISLLVFLTLILILEQEINL